MVSSNFSFLAGQFPALEEMGRLAETCLYTDANSCIYKMNSLAVAIVDYIFEFDKLEQPSGKDNTHANRIKFLQEKDLLPKEISDILYVLGIKRDTAADEGHCSFEECRTLIELTHSLSVWFMQVYGDEGYEPAPFVMPDDIRSKAGSQEMPVEAEIQPTEKPPAEKPSAEKPSAGTDSAQEAALPKPAHSREQVSGRMDRAEKASQGTRLSERETRYIIDALIESDSNKEDRARKAVKKSFRLFQLKTMGFISLFIGPLVLFSTSVTYGLKFPDSISETATIANRSGVILPFCLGALALFALTYAIVHAHDLSDKIFSSCTAVGFTIVAMQLCLSDYIEVPRVGLLGVVPEVSNTIHLIGAVGGFGAMIFWIMLCFRKSDKRKELRTKEKNLRDSVYFYLGIAMILSLGLFLLDSAGLFGVRFPVVFVAECAMLLFGGVACLIKGGLFLKDRAP